MEGKSMIGTRALAVVWIMLGSVVAAYGGEVSFQKDIYPVLQANCALCHSPGGIGYAQSGFSVETYQTLMEGTKYAAVINPGSSISSNLMWLLDHRAHASINMPKVCEQVSREFQKCALASQSARWLSQHELTLIKEWVDRGAKDN
ncbi:MAG: hypothetical protein KGL11_09725 [Alphaproteobacteria bacterium]|nr:hypothetical protein [Alphaproteobacteria bacterium]